jgi:CubicO group peptidase (beta-lactamase class C family)
MSPTSLPRKSPSSAGVRATGIGAFLDALEITPGVELHSLMVLRHGAVVAAGWWSPYGPDGLHLLYSLSKSFTVSALGVAIDKGLLNLEDLVLSYFPELDAGAIDPRTRRMQLGHLAAMSSGHRFDTWDDVVAGDPENPVRGFLLLPPSDEPGSVFAYNQSCTYTLASVIQKVAKCTLTEFLRETVLDPIGASKVAWTQQPPGQDQGFTGLHATTETIARLGQLYLDRGNWDGQAVLPTTWVTSASEVHSVTRGVGDAAVAEKPDWELGYGYQFWRSSYGYRADGAFGQFSLVIPEFDAVIAMTGQTTDTQALLNLVWTHLIPAFGPAGLAAGRDDEALSERLAGLALTPCAGDPAPSSEEQWSDAVFSAGEVGPGVSVDRVTISRTSTRWRASLHGDGERLDIPIASTWRPGSSDGDDLPVVASGGWQQSGHLRVEVIFVETPHRLMLECQLPSQTFTAEWAAAPRRPISLLKFRAPLQQG